MKTSGKTKKKTTRIVLPNGIVIEGEDLHVFTLGEPDQTSVTSDTTDDYDDDLFDGDGAGEAYAWHLLDF